MHAVMWPFAAPILRKNVLPYIRANTVQLNLLTEACRKHHVRSIIDLGSGDGVVCRHLAQELGVRAEGVELNCWLVWFSRYAAWRQGVDHLTKFSRTDLFDADLKGVDAVVLHVIPSMMPELERKFERDLPDSTLVISARFPLATWVPEESANKGTHINNVWVYRKPSATDSSRTEPLVE